MGNCFLLLTFFCPLAYSQLFSFGVKGGTPLSESTSSGMVNDHTLGGGLSTLNIRRYTIGPTFEIGLPFGLRFEADALYRRLDVTEHYFLGPDFGMIIRKNANPWEFPLLLKYSFRPRRFQPFVDAGGTFRHIASVDESVEKFFDREAPPLVTRYHNLNMPLIQGGMVFGGGVRVKIARVLKLMPEVRYTRWTSRDLFPTRNQVEFLLGVGL
ncbi:MAG TPA: hypothetical protein VKT81_13975 [Bryobacteraceae bacterium]|nr:hypothetical protein [Bryobacteraceae bacterium]